MLPSEELRHFHLLRHETLADPLKEIILRLLSAGRLGKAPRGDGLNLPSQRDFFSKQLVSSLAVLGALVRIVQMRHVSPPYALSPQVVHAVIALPLLGQAPLLLDLAQPCQHLSVSARGAV